MRRSSTGSARKPKPRRRKMNSPVFGSTSNLFERREPSANVEDKAATDHFRDRKTRWKTRFFLDAICFDKARFWVRRRILAVLIIGLALILILLICKYEDSKENNTLVPPDPETPLPPSWSPLKSFKKSVICADSEKCALIGKSILHKNGSAMDAAISTLICNGLVNMQSMGLGGGFIMTIYDRKTRKAAFLNARECAPLKANLHMFNGKPPKSSQEGPLSISVPGELAGYWEAHKRYGKLPWVELFQPSIELCENGVDLTKALHDDLRYNAEKIRQFADLKEMFVDPETKDFWKPGTRLKPRAKFCETLRIIAEKNASELYNGSLARILVEDVQRHGGILTARDLSEYRARWEEPVETELLGNTKLHATGLPGSGPLLAFILNVFENYKFTPDSIKDPESTALTYHRILETFKFAYGFRTKLGDPAFADATMFIKNLTSKEFAESVRAKIDDERTYNDPLHYESELSFTEDHGTSHVSVISSEGDAVSVTSTINIYFGSGLFSERTGILLNSGMDDLGIPSKLNYFEIPSNLSNYIAPGKRALSSMSPTILTDSKGDVRMVVGAAGGTRITTALAFAIARYLWLGNSLKEAVDAPRIHHQLYPMTVSYEYGVLKRVVDLLKKLGHRTSRYRDRGSVICFVTQENGTIYANADYRKGGNVHGLD